MSSLKASLVGLTALVFPLSVQASESPFFSKNEIKRLQIIHKQIRSSNSTLQSAGLTACFEGSASLETPSDEERKEISQLIRSQNKEKQALGLIRCL